MAKIDIKRCHKALAKIYVEGDPQGQVRHKAIEDAIASIQEDGLNALSEAYIGVKNYAQFGDQREDHKYGYCPRHGDIVFGIGRNRQQLSSTLGDDEIYLLQCVRDFGVIVDEENPSNTPYRKALLNLCDVLKRLFAAIKMASHYGDAIIAIEVDVMERDSQTDGHI